MKYSFAIGIPTLIRADLLNPTLEKYFIQFPDVEIFIVNNGDKTITSRSKKNTIHKPDENYGVAKSWNYLCDQIFKNHEYALILNDDIEINLNQDEIENFLVNQKFDLVRCQSKFHLCSFALHKNYFSKEIFDESFYPAYFEDRDYLYRLKLNEGKILEHSFLNPNKFINSATISKDGGDPSINKNFYQLQELYCKKWGGSPGLEKFRKPFQKVHNEVTFIIPTINRPTLSRSIQSLETQTNPNWQSIIIYDTQDQVDLNKFKSNKIQTLKSNNSGKIGSKNYSLDHHSSAGLIRNCGINRTTTNWTAFLDDDDVITPNYVDLLFTKYSHFDLVIFRMNYLAHGCIIPNPVDSQIKFGNVGISFAFKTPKKPILFSNNSHGEDYIFVDNLIKSGYRYTITDEVCYIVNPPR